MTRALLTVGIAVIAVAPVPAALSASGPLRGLPWNWQGKVLETLLTLVAAFLRSSLPLGELGVGLRLVPGFNAQY